MNFLVVFGDVAPANFGPSLACDDSMLFTFGNACLLIQQVHKMKNLANLEWSHNYRDGLKRKGYKIT